MSAALLASACPKSWRAQANAHLAEPLTSSCARQTIVGTVMESGPTSLGQIRADFTLQARDSTGAWTIKQDGVELSIEYVWYLPPTEPEREAVRVRLSLLGQHLSATCGSGLAPGTTPVVKISFG
jgi:hypothetical protein